MLTIVTGALRCSGSATSVRRRLEEPGIARTASQIAENLVGLVGFAKSLGIQALADVGMCGEGYPLMRTLNLGRHRPC
jgi:hypothetical protein